MVAAMKEFNEYEAEVKRTWNDSRDASLLGLAGEVGEFLDQVKKERYHGALVDRDKKLKELGDVFWYLTSCCLAEGFSLQEVAEANVAKLRARYPNGWSEKAAAARADERQLELPIGKP